jgi:hypothetical protein
MFWALKTKEKKNPSKFGWTLYLEGTEFSVIWFIFIVSNANFLSETEVVTIFGC